MPYITYSTSTSPVTETDEGRVRLWGISTSSSTTESYWPDTYGRVYATDDCCLHTVNDTSVIRSYSIRRNHTLIPWETTTQTYDLDSSILSVFRRMDPEERRRREEYERKLEERRRIRALEKQAADEKAERLLISVLSEQQRKEYLEHGHFHVRSPTGRLYRVGKGWAGNVKVVPHEKAEYGESIESLCIHPKIRVPICDNMLAQKLMIESAEEDFRQIANIRDLQPQRRFLV